MDMYTRLNATYSGKDFQTRSKNNYVYNLEYFNNAVDKGLEENDYASLKLYFPLITNLNFFVVFDMFPSHWDGAYQPYISGKSFANDSNNLVWRIKEFNFKYDNFLNKTNTLWASTGWDGQEFGFKNRNWTIALMERHWDTYGTRSSMSNKYTHYLKNDSNMYLNWMITKQKKNNSQDLLEKTLIENKIECNFFKEFKRKKYSNFNIYLTETMKNDDSYWFYGGLSGGHGNNKGLWNNLSFGLNIAKGSFDIIEKDLSTGMVFVNTVNYDNSFGKIEYSFDYKHNNNYEAYGTGELETSLDNIVHNKFKYGIDNVVYFTNYTHLHFLWTTQQLEFRDKPFAKIDKFSIVPTFSINGDRSRTPNPVIRLFWTRFFYSGDFNKYPNIKTEEKFRIGVQAEWSF
jgi:hypothetical protein